jgi:hypothetical protein
MALSRSSRPPASQPIRKARVLFGRDSHGGDRAAGSATGSLSTFEVQRHRDRRVPGWGTAREVLMMVSAFARPYLAKLWWGLTTPARFLRGARLSETANHGPLLRLGSNQVRSKNVIYSFGSRHLAP